MKNHAFGSRLTIAALVSTWLALAASATTVGDLFTEVLHPATASHRRIEPAERARMGITDGTVRVSVGIEDPYDIVADIDQALERA